MFEIVDKLIEFNHKVSDEFKIEQDLLQSFDAIMDGKAANGEQINALQKALLWPCGTLFNY